MRSSRRIPQEGELKPTGTTVTISVSSGGETVKIPKVAGLSSAAAIRALENRQFQVNPIKEQSETVPADIVIRTDPKAGRRVEPNSVVTVVISDGPAPLIVPDVRGLTQVDATQRLANAGFRVAATSESSSSVPSGQVIRTQPAAGSEAARDSTVTLVISSGAKQATVPDVVGPERVVGHERARGRGLPGHGVDGDGSGQRRPGHQPEPQRR